MRLITAGILMLPVIVGFLFVWLGNAAHSPGCLNVGAVLLAAFIPLVLVCTSWALFCYVLRTIVSICRNAGK